MSHRITYSSYNQQKAKFDWENISLQLKENAIRTMLYMKFKVLRNIFN